MLFQHNVAKVFPYKREGAARPLAALICVAVGLLTNGCIRSEVNKTVDDLQDIANQAETVVNILQASGFPRTHEREENITALKFANAASRAAWTAASESNSTDSLYRRNKRVAEVFSSINAPDLSRSQELPVRAAIEALQSGIQILRGRLNESDAHMRSTRGVGDRVPTAIPATLTSRLQKIKDKATQTIAKANSLLGEQQP